MTAPKSLQESTERLRARNDQMTAYLKGDMSPLSRVVNSPDTNLEDATERAKKYWDSLEKRKPSVFPKRKTPTDES